MKEKVLGISWLVLGLVLAIYFTIQLIEVALRADYNVVWYITQAVFPLFCLFVAIFGMGVLNMKGVFKKAIYYLSIIAIVYLLAFLLMGAHNTFALITGLVGLLFFIASVAISIAISREQT